MAVPLIQLTRGSRVVRNQIMVLMESDLEPALVLFRSQYNLKVKDLPPPVKFNRYEAEALDVLPQLALSVTRVRDYRRVDLIPGEQEKFEVRYQCRLFCWIKHLDRTPTEQLRDDYATVVSGVLLAEQGLRGGHRFRVDETSMDLSFSDVQHVRGDRHVAGASVSFDVFHQESVRRVPLGTADAVTVEVSVLPGHPGME